MRRKLCFLSGLILAVSTLSIQAADLVYVGEVDEATGAFTKLTPVGTPVGGPIVVDDAALAAGSIGIADITSIDVNVGNFCFATDGGTCGGVGALVPITSIDSAAITGTDGTLGGSFSVTAFSPTFMVSIPIAFDLDGGTFAADGDALGTVSGTGALSVGVDSDGDGVDDALDNCTDDANPDQVDSNGDGIGNRCDADIDNNCIVNFLDIGMFPPAFNSAPGDANYNENLNLNTANPGINFLDYIILTGSFQMAPGPSVNECVPGLGT